jgi:hypothetical protein
MFHLLSNSIDWEIIGQGGMRFEKSFKSYSNDQWHYVENKYDLTW